MRRIWMLRRAGHARSYAPLVAKSTEGITQMFVVIPHASAGTGLIPGGLHLGRRRPRVRQGDANPGPGG